MNVKGKIVSISIGGVPLKGFGSQTYGREPSDPVIRAFLGLGSVEVPYDSVSQAERGRMESDARLRAEARLRDWKRNA